MNPKPYVDQFGVHNRYDKLKEKPVLSDEIRTTSETGGQKGVKPERMDLIPPEFLLMLGRVYGMGAEKYAPHNWLKGYEWSKSIAAMQRHLAAWQSGEDVDPESGESHLGHAAWHCATLFTFSEHELGEDDRIVRFLPPK